MLDDECDFKFNFKHKEIRFNVQFKDLMNDSDNITINDRYDIKI
jgi:hypothetical protein